MPRIREPSSRARRTAPSGASPEAATGADAPTLVQAADGALRARLTLDGRPREIQCSRWSTPGKGEILIDGEPLSYVQAVLLAEELKVLKGEGKVQPALADGMLSVLGKGYGVYV